MRNLVVRTAGVDDLRPLVATLGDDGPFPDWLHRSDWLRRQRAGSGELLVALLAGRHVGMIYLWLDDADEAPIRRHLPRVPLLRHLRVSRDYQRRQIGTRLIAAAEERLRMRGHGRVALAVDVTNTEAAGLYERLNYRDWGFGDVACLPLEPEQQDMDLCRVLVKTLTDDPARGRRDQSDRAHE